MKHTLFYVFILLLLSGCMQIPLEESTNNATCGSCVNGTNGIDGYTPIYGIDYVNGTNGIDGSNVSGGNPFDQELNTTNDVSFTGLNLTQNYIICSGEYQNFTQYAIDRYTRYCDGDTPIECSNITTADVCANFAGCSWNGTGCNGISGASCYDVFSLDCPYVSVCTFDSTGFCSDSAGTWNGSICEGGDFGISCNNLLCTEGYEGCYNESITGNYLTMKSNPTMFYLNGEKSSFMVSDDEDGYIQLYSDSLIESSIENDDGESLITMEGGFLEIFSTDYNSDSYINLYDGAINFYGDEVHNNNVYFSSDINVSGTIYYGALQANSPILETTNEPFVTRCSIADNGKWVVSYIHFDGIKYISAIEEVTKESKNWYNNACYEKISKFSLLKYLQTQNIEKEIISVRKNTTKIMYIPYNINDILYDYKTKTVSYDTTPELKTKTR